MMSPGRRKFCRRPPTRSYRKIFVLAVEGTKTEPQYFAIFNDENSVIRVNCLKGSGGNSPIHLLERMKRKLQEEGLRKSDEAWLVVDKDQWTDTQLLQLHDWAQESSNHGLALSNPKFEYWLLLHFEDGDGIRSSQRCSQKLERYLPGYNKGIDIRRITDDMIADAIERAKKRDNPPCSCWPQAIGTTVYRLVENILRSRIQS